MYNKAIIVFILFTLNFSFSQCLGDVNEDSIFDVSDIIIILNHILEEEILNDNIFIIADFNSDQSIDIFDIIEVINLILYDIQCFSGITETDSDGNLIGNIDEDDWCEFEFDMSATDSYFGLNPSYPNPLTPQEWGPFRNSYRICYQFSTPFDSTWSNFNAVNFNIVSNSSDLIYSYSDNYTNGQLGVCSYIADSLVVANSIYRMFMVSGDFECHGDVQFNE